MVAHRALAKAELKASAAIQDSFIPAGHSFDAMGAIAIKDAKHITRLRSIADLFAELGLTIKAAPDAEDFVEDNPDEIVATVHNEHNQWDLEVRDVDDAEIDESTVEKVRFIYFRTFRAAGERKGHPRRRPHRDEREGLIPPPSVVTLTLASPG